MGWHSKTSVQGLLAGYARTLTELRARGVIRTNNAPLGDYAEWLLAKTLGGVLDPSTSAKSHDLTSSDGRRVQVKARLVSRVPQAGQLQTSAFRSWDFDVAALLLFGSEDYRPLSAFLVPVDLVKEHSRYRKHVNGSVVFIRPPLTTDLSVKDISEDVAAAADDPASD